VSVPSPVDVGGCDGCRLACASTCGQADDRRTRHVRLALAGTGVGTVVLSLGPGLVARQPVVLASAVIAVVLGAWVAGTSLLALRAGRPDGDPWAKRAFGVAPLAVAAMVLTAAGAVVARLV
jgi:hypothetical protein